jgi:sortase A
MAPWGDGMRILEKILLLIGVLCLGIYGFFTIQSHLHQEMLEESFDQLVVRPTVVAIGEPATGEPATAPKPALREGDVVGRLQIPRLDLSVMVMEGIASKTLRLGAGHIPGTVLPGEAGNSGIAAHRDSYFRKLANIRTGDTIQFQTVDGIVRYRVSSTQIVMPSATEVLRPGSEDMLTLVTCYPFSYVGPAPKRFIVQATRDQS